MDFGISFLTNNVMLPILDFFYGIVPSYGLAIVALTLVIRLALYPLSAGSIRSMRRTRAVQPYMQKRQEEIKTRYGDDPAKQQEEMGKLFKEVGNPLAGCLPVLFQMPVLFALFATLRGSPFADINYSVNLEIFPAEQIERIVPQAFATKPQNIYVAENVHAQVAALLTGGNKLAVGENTKVLFQTAEGKPIKDLLGEYGKTNLTPKWQVLKGEERVQIDAEGTIVALQPGEATIQGTIPGLAAHKGFLFIKALGQVGVRGENGEINWDIVCMVLFFGISLYVNQILSGSGSSNANSQQETVNKITPVLFSGMFLFFPLPAGVLMYIVIANIFQTFQTFILSREPLPENIQKIVDAESAKQVKEEEKESLPFERKSVKKKEKMEQNLPKKSQNYKKKKT